ncbi:MAG: hypothetical protein JXJ22_16590 [Bacteroidales bacterium]|nr:hypothetical protein [Bacteroidales bacterium]
MKSIFKFSRTSILLVLFSLYSLSLFSQQVIVPNLQLPYENDSVIIKLDDNYRGSMQWEYSKDFINWSDIESNYGDSLVVRYDSNAYFRAKIIEGTCDPIYSDTLLVTEYYDNRDGQYYKVVRVGDQVWLAENLNYYTPAGSYYAEDDSINNHIYGRLYNWEMAADVCPAGWNLPSDEDWKDLERTLGMMEIVIDSKGDRGTDQGDQIKVGNSSGFDALLAGFRSLAGNYQAFDVGATFWTSTEENTDSSWYRGIVVDKPTINRFYYNKLMGFSVRCIKELLPTIVVDSIFNIKRNTLQVSSTIIALANDTLVSAGICYSENPSPDINDVTIESNVGEMSFILSVDALQPNKQYYFRAYMQTKHGLYYSEDADVLTPLTSLAIVSTDTVESISINSALVRGTVADNGGVTITERGICYSQEPQPVIADGKVTSGAGSGSFSANIINLESNIKYYVRAYAINEKGTSYGEELNFRTHPVNEVGNLLDSRDNRTYTTVKIGYQWWMSENLDYYTPNGSWYPADDSLTNHIFGRLYDWTQAQLVCPTDWHLASDNDWKKLESEIGMDISVLDDMGLRGTDQAEQLTEGGTSGFNALYAGFRDIYGDYQALGEGSNFWTSTEFNATTSLYRGFASTDPRINRFNYDKEMGFSIRCVKDLPPVVETVSVDSVNKTFATIKGNVLYDGGVTFIKRGICWAITPNPTVVDAQELSPGTEGEFVVSILGLTSDETYYVRAFAINSVDTSYGEQLSFTTIILPSVTTGSISNLTTTSVSISGNVSDDGGTNVFERGICWSTNELPTTLDQKTIDGTGTGSFTGNISGLDLNKIYYARAYAINNKGTAYGDNIQFRTLPLNEISDFTDARDGQSYNTVNIGGQWWMSENLNFYTPAGSYYMNNDSISNHSYGKLYTWSTAMTVCPDSWYLPTDQDWKRLESTLGMSEVELDYTGQRGTDQGDQLKDENTSGFNALFGGYADQYLTFNAFLTGATFWSSTEIDLTTSWYRGLANNPQIHRAGYPKDWVFSVRCIQESVPEISTKIVENITDSSATSGGVISHTGGVDILESGICWNETGNPTIFEDTTRNAGNPLDFSVSLKDLSPNTNYYVRAYAINSVGLSYGDVVLFTTEIGVPEVSIVQVVSKTDSSATIQSNIISNGGEQLLAKGVCWSLSPNPTIDDDTVNNGTGSGLFNSLIKGLLPNTTYHVRAYAVNSVDIDYSNDITVTTNYGIPRLTTDIITEITDSSATGGGNITYDGGRAILARGVCWSTSSNPTVTNDTTMDGTLTGSYTSRIKNLLPNQQYYVRAYVTNSQNTYYGNQEEFSTNIGAISVTTETVISITAVSALSGGSILSDGGLPILYKGVCWSETEYPTLEEDHTSNGSGNTSFVSNLTGLSADVLYYVRAYAINAADTAYGNQLSFTTLDGIPVLTTTSVTSVTDVSASSGGTISSNGGSAIILKGVCWSTVSSPTVNDSRTENGGGSTGFTSSITGLLPVTQYYVRAFAINAVDTAYGEEHEFTTLPTLSTMTDLRDGQDYATVTIGAQTWLAQNLNYYTATGSAYYDNDSATYASVYGRLYNWTTAMNGSSSSILNPSGVQGVCPSGWHLPSVEEWNQLASQLGGSSLAGGKMKEPTLTYWTTPNLNASNSSGFTALPAGGFSGSYNGINLNTYYWSATDDSGTNASTVSLDYNSGASVISDKDKGDLYSVRCVKD